MYERIGRGNNSSADASGGHIFFHQCSNMSHDTRQRPTEVVPMTTNRSPRPRTLVQREGEVSTRSGRSARPLAKNRATMERVWRATGTTGSTRENSQQRPRTVLDKSERVAAAPEKKMTTARSDATHQRQGDLGGCRRCPLWRETSQTATNPAERVQVTEQTRTRHQTWRVVRRESTLAVVVHPPKHHRQLRQK